MAIKDIINICANIVIIISVIFLIFQLRIALKQYQNSITQKKRDRSLVFIARWNDFEFSKIRGSVMLYFKPINMNNFEGYKENLEKNIEIRRNAARILNFFEEVAIGVNNDIVNIDIIYTFFQATVTYYWELLYPFTDWLRKRDHDETIFIESERMYDLFIKRCSEKTSVPPGRYWSA